MKRIISNNNLTVFSSNSPLKTNVKLSEKVIHHTCYLLLEFDYPDHRIIILDKIFCYLHAISSQAFSVISTYHR